MDLKDLTPINDTVNVPIVHPTTLDPLLTDDKYEMSINVYAPHAKKYNKAVFEKTDRRLNTAKDKRK